MARLCHDVHETRKIGRPYKNPIDSPHRKDFFYIRDRLRCLDLYDERDLVICFLGILFEVLKITAGPYGCKTAAAVRRIAAELHSLQCVRARSSPSAPLLLVHPGPARFESNPANCWPADRRPVGLPLIETRMVLRLWRSSGKCSVSINNQEPERQPSAQPSRDRQIRSSFRLRVALAALATLVC